MGRFITEVLFGSGRYGSGGRITLIVLYLLVANAAPAVVGALPTEQESSSDTSWQGLVLRGPPLVVTSAL